MTPDDVLDWVEDKFGHSRGIILGKARNADVTKSRHIAMFLVVERCGYSFPQTGRVFGRDHSTILNAYHKIKGLILDGRLDLKMNGYTPKLRDSVKLDNIIDDSLSMLKSALNRAFARNAFDTTIALIELAKKLDTLGKEDS